MSIGRWVQLVIVVLAVLAAVAFSVQNSSRTTQLSFDVGIAAWQLEQPVSVPLLIGICFGAGLVLGLGALIGRVVRLSSKVRQLEDQAAVSGFAGKRSEDASRW